MKPKESEAEFQDKIVKLARLCGWKVAHFRPAMTSRGQWITPVSADGKGFPDLVMVKPPHILFVECKSATGKLTLEQKDWANILHDVMIHPNQRVFQRIWRPSDEDEIEKFLTERGENETTK